MIDLLRDKHGVVAPGADLLLSNAFDVMMADVIEAAHIGKGVIDGVECDHLAFRNMDTDWQIWIEAGARPIPRKYVITSKGVGRRAAIHAAHQGLEDRRAGRRLCVQARPGAKKVALGDLADIDEVPQGTTKAGGKK